MYELLSKCYCISLDVLYYLDETMNSSKFQKNVLAELNKGDIDNG